MNENAAYHRARPARVPRKARPAKRAGRHDQAARYDRLTREQLLAEVRALQATIAAQAAREDQSIVRELEAHQLELEAQNWELRESHGVLQESQARYADLYDLTPICCLTIDDDTRIIEANLTAGTLLGAGRALLIGIPLTAFVVGDDRIVLRELLARCARDRSRAHGQITLVTQGGRRVTAQITSVPRQDLRGNITGFRTTLTDITALKRAQDKLAFLAQASATLGSSFDYRRALAAVAEQAVPVLADICVVDLVDAAGAPSRLKVAFADPLAAKRLAPLCRAAPHADETTLFGHVLRTREPLLVPECSPRSLASIAPGRQPDLLIRRCGARSFVIVPLVVRAAAFGAITLVVTGSDRRHTDATLSTARDLAAHAALAIDNARLYERAQEAIRARDDVLSFVSHDLRNPLMGIQLTAETILRSPPEGGERRKGWQQLERIRRGARQMQRMIEDLLDVSSLDSGRMTLACTPHDLGRLFDDAAMVLGPLAAEKNLTLRFDVEGGNLSVSCDGDRVLQVLSNLIGNAIKFTPADGTITITGRNRAGRAEVTVSDTGSGIPPNARPHIFERFWRGDAKTHKGRGLGLYIAKGLVEAHGGTLAVESVGSAGVVFSFTLPLAAASQVDSLRQTMKTTRGSLGHRSIVGPR
jgi:PAS domain S-box-containing protein